MAVNFSRGGGSSVPPATLRYINRVASDLATSTNTSVESVMNMIISGAGDGIPAVGSTFVYDRRGSGTALAGQYSLLEGTTEVAEGSEWDIIDQITFNDVDENGIDTETTVNSLVANGNAVRLFIDANNWGFYTIDSIATTANTVDLEVTHISSRGMVNIPTASNFTLFIGFDAAAGTQGDSALAINVFIEPNGFVEGNEETATVSMIATEGNSVSSVIQLDTLTIARNGTVATQTGDQQNVPLMLGGNNYQYDVTYSNMNRTVTTSLETVTESLIARDSETVLIVRPGMNALLVDINTDSESGFAFRDEDRASKTIIARVTDSGTGIAPVGTTSYDWRYTDGTQVRVASPTDFNVVATGGSLANGAEVNTDRLIVDPSDVVGTLAFQCFVTGGDGRVASGQATLFEVNDGDAGIPGFNNAVVPIYIRSVEAPNTVPLVSGTYTFNTGILTFPGDDTVNDVHLGQWSILAARSTDLNTGRYFVTDANADITDPDINEYRPLSDIRSAQIGNQYQLVIDTTDNASNDRATALMDLGMDDRIGFTAAGDTDLANATNFNIFRIISAPVASGTDDLIFMDMQLESAGGASGVASHEITTRAIVSSPSNGWSGTVPAGTVQLWQRFANAISRDMTDLIAPDEWSSAVQSGTMGENGQDGLNTVSVFLYQRTMTNTRPDGPNEVEVYNFDDHTLSVPRNNNWTVTFPPASDGMYLWITFAVAVGRMATTMIAVDEWSVPELFTADGVDGLPGDSFRSVYLYQNFVTRPNPPDGAAGFNTAGEAVDATPWVIDPETPTGGQAIWVAQRDLRQPGSDGDWVAIGDNWSVRQSGVAGERGRDGRPGPRFAERTVYTDPAVGTAPTEAPSARIIWATGGITELTDGWELTPPTDVATSDLRVYYSVIVFIDTTGEEIISPAPVTGSQPIRGIDFSGLVTFRDGDDAFGVNGGTLTAINGGFIATNTINADRIRSGTITGDQIRGDTISGIGLTIGTVTTDGRTSGQRLEISDGRIIVYDDMDRVRVIIGNLG